MLYFALTVVRLSLSGGPVDLPAITAGAYPNPSGGDTEPRRVARTVVARGAGNRSAIQPSRATLRGGTFRPAQLRERLRQLGLRAGCIAGQTRLADRNRRLPDGIIMLTTGADQAPERRGPVSTPLGPFAHVAATRATMMGRSADTAET